MGHSKIGWNKERLSGLTLSQFKKLFEAIYPEADLESEFYGLYPEKRPKPKAKRKKVLDEGEY